jgi:hypothetical protein
MSSSISPCRAARIEKNRMATHPLDISSAGSESP